MELVEIVKKAQEGDEKALEALLEHAHQRFNMVMAVHKYRYEDRGDIEQDAMIIVLRKLHALKEPKSFNGWIAMVLYSAKHQFYRKRWRWVEQPTDEMGHVSDHRKNSPDMSLEREELRAFVRDTIDDMSPKKREVFIRKYLWEQTMREIEVDTGICIGSQKRLLYHGRRELRVIFKQKAG